MSAKIKDLVHVVAPGGRPHGAAAAGGLSSFLLSYETGDALERAVERVRPGGDAARNTLVVGGPGCGKSRLLDAVAALFEPGPDAGLHPRVAQMRRAARRQRVTVVRVAGGGAEMRLSAALERATLERLGEPPAPASGSRLDAVARAAGSLPDGACLLYVIDDLDRWLDAASRYALENAHALVRLGELSREAGVAACAAAGEYVLSHDSGAGGQGWIAAMLDTYRIEYLPAHALRAATANNVLVKNARQRGEILQVLELLRAKLPGLACTDGEFVELYPLERSTWAVGGQLHRWIRDFSFPDFACRAAESVRRRPASSLFALNDMFALYEPQLRHVEALAPSFEAYDRLVAKALPRLGQSQRLWGLLALQAIFMHTLAGIAADVRTITNSVLLYDLHGGRSSYEMMSAVLGQLEALDGGQLVAAGEGDARRYSLVTGEREALMMRVDEMAEQIDPDEASAALLGSGGTFFADWPLAAAAAERGRHDLWEIEQGDGWVALEARAVGEPGPAADRPRLVLFAPGRPWHEANEHARQRPATACWIGAMPTPAERETLRRRLAAARLAKSEEGRRYADLPSVVADLEAKAAAVFRRVYVDGGTRVTTGRSDTIADLVSGSREESLVVRLLPAPPPAGPAAAEPAAERLWLAHLLAAERDGVDAMAAGFEPAAWVQRLEAWYRARVERDDAGVLRALGERGAAIPGLAAALDARQLFDLALHYVRRALGAGSIDGLGASLAKVFESPERLWVARERLAWLDGFAEWVAGLDRTARYLGSAEAVDDPDVEALRRSLVEWAGRLEEFTGEPRRAAFFNAFAAYREEYAAIYRRLHDETVGAEAVDALCGDLVSSEEWAALEALSSLAVGTQSYLVDAINLVSVLRAAQCAAGAVSVADHPLCACGFRFSDRERLDAVAANARGFLARGVEHHHGLLRSRRAELRDLLVAHKSAFPLETMRAIADLTKDGPLPLPVDPATIEAVNELLARAGEWNGEGRDDEPIALPVERA